MTSSISWIDRDGLAETLSRFGVSSASLAPTTGTTGVAKVEPILDTDPPIEPFEAPIGRLRDRLEAFLDWLMQHSGCRVAFIIDRDGLPLVDRGAGVEMMAIASSVMQLVERINRRTLPVVGQAVKLELEKGQLVLVSVVTSIGDYTVGHMGGHAPDHTLRDQTAEGLQAVFQNAHEPAPR